jgi:site-specific recombinase XerD
MLKLYFTDRDLLALPIADERGEVHHVVEYVDRDTGELNLELKALVDQVDIKHRRPFFIDEHGRYWEGSNWFPSTELTNPNTLEAYGRDLDRWFRFLHEARGERKPFEARNADLNAYKRVRRTDMRSDVLVRAKTWNRELAPLKEFYEWAKEKGFISSFPFETKKVKGWGGKKITVLKATDSWGEDEIVRSVETEAYKFFRDVGLRGLNPDGSAPPAEEQRNRAMAERDCAIADLMTYCGLRAAEALTLFKAELPVPYESTERHPMRIVGKGGKVRTVHVPRVLLGRLLDYSEIWRQTVVEQCQDARGWAKEPPEVAELIRIVMEKGARFRAPGKKGNTKETTILLMNSRRNVFVSDEDGRLEEPAVLFLCDPQAGGHGLTYDGFAERWESAKMRVHRYRKDLDHLTPHMLRHTFAINYLSRLTDETERSLQEKGIRKRTFAPLLQLRKEMGHSSVETTMKYLNYTHQSQDIQDRAHRAYSTALEER